jgi:hypothetical protein
MSRQTSPRPTLRLPLAVRQGLFMLLEGLTGEGSFTAKTDKKGKKGQKPLRPFCPFLPFLSFLFFKSLLSSRAEPSMNRPWAASPPDFRLPATVL